jgi:hypothetical protein
MLMEVNREQRGHFNLIHHETGFKADIYPCTRDLLHTWGLANVRSVELEGDTIHLAPPEYVIIRKLQYFREGRAQKHLRDISRMLLGLGEAWDRGLLETMIREHSLQDEWQQAAAMAE